MCLCVSGWGDFLQYGDSFSLCSDLEISLPLVFPACYSENYFVNYSIDNIFI